MINSQQLDVLVGNTISVKTFSPDVQAIWRETLKHTLKQLHPTDQSNEVAFYRALLAILLAVEKHITAHYGT